MKLKSKLFVSLLSVLVLSSCGNGGNTKLYSIEKVEKDASISIEKTSYSINEIVNFSVECSKNAYSLLIDDGGNYEVQYESLGNDKYSFKMPSCNLFIRVSGYDNPDLKLYNVNLIKDNDINATVSKTSAHRNESVSINVDFSGDYSLSVKKTSGDTIKYSGSHPNYEFIMPESDVNITINKIQSVFYSVEQNVDDGIVVEGLNDEYEEGNEVIFSVEYFREYEVSITDEFLNPIPFENEENDYSFTMPSKNVLVNIRDCIKDKLTFEQRYQKLWDTPIVHNEMVMLYTHIDGTTYGELLYEPTSIIEVKDYLMTKIFKEDVDFEINGRKIIVKNISSTKMPYLNYDQYNADVMSLIGTGISVMESSKAPSGYVLYSEYPHIVKYTVLVTYEHADTWNYHEIYKEGNLLTNTLSKLSQGGEFNLAIYGDSNATGAVTSGYWKEDYEGTHRGAADLFNESYDFQEGFPHGFKHALEEVYGVNCTLYNPSVGGKTSVWMNQKPLEGETNLWTKKTYDHTKTRLQNWLVDNVPDLVVFVFGNNDLSFKVEPETYLKNIDDAINEIKSKNPNAEFIISLPKRSNPLSDQDDILLSQKYLNIVKKYVNDEGSGVAFHDMTTFTADLLQSKDAYSLLGNGINHSNDFLARQWVSIFLNALEIPEAGKEWNYSKDPTIKDIDIDYAKAWKNVVSDTGSLENPINVDSGVKLPSLSSWGEGYTRKEKVYLDGLKFDFRSENMKYGGSVKYKSYDDYLLSTTIGFFFTKEVGSWDSSTAYPFGDFSFNLNDIYGQERIFVGKNNDYNKSTILYTDSDCKNIFTSNDTNQMILNRIEKEDHTDRAGVSVEFKKISAEVYSIKIGALLGAYMWENNPNYDSKDVSCTYYIKAEAFKNILNEDGSTYLNVYGYGPEYNGTGYGGDMFVTITNLTSIEPSPIPLGDEEIIYNSGSTDDAVFYYDRVIEESVAKGVEIKHKSDPDDSYVSIDISQWEVGPSIGCYYMKISNIGMEDIVKKYGTGEYAVRLTCSNGTCVWNLKIQ